MFFLNFNGQACYAGRKNKKRHGYFFKESAMPNVQSHALYLKCLKPQPHPEQNDYLVVSTDLPGAMIRDASAVHTARTDYPAGTHQPLFITFGL